MIQHITGCIERLRRNIAARETQRDRDRHRLRTLTARRKVPPKKLQRTCAEHDRVLLAQQMELYNLLRKAQDAMQVQR